jgi:hypothetical protein
MVNLQNTPSAGPLTAADLAEARRFNAGTVLHLHRATVAQFPPCHGDCRQGRDCNAIACAPEGGVPAEPVPTQKPRAFIGAMLVLLGWPIVAALVGIAAFVAEHWPMAWPLG